MSNTSAHNHHHHAHAHTLATGDERRVAIAAALTVSFMLVEVAGGIFASSLALLADAGHMLSDSAGLILAWVAFRIARRPPDPRRSYGFDRIHVLVAFLNGTALIAIAGWVLFEAFGRMNAPRDVLATPMLIVAALGLLVNLVAFKLLHGADRDNLNVKGAMLHVMGDILGSVAAVAAAIIILATGWMAADPLLSILVALIIARSALALVKDSAHILLEGSPDGLDARAIEKDLTAHIDAVQDIHHVHAWAISHQRPIVTLHARADERTAPETVTAAIKARLREKFGIDHATVEIEHGACADEAPVPAR